MRSTASEFNSICNVNYSEFDLFNVQFKIPINNNKLQPVVNCPLCLVRKGGKISSEIVYFLLQFDMTFVANALSVLYKYTLSGIWFSAESGFVVSEP